MGSPHASEMRAGEARKEGRRGLSSTHLSAQIPAFAVLFGALCYPPQVVLLPPPAPLCATPVPYLWRFTPESRHAKSPTRHLLPRMHVSSNASDLGLSTTAGDQGALLAMPQVRRTHLHPRDFPGASDWVYCARPTGVSRLRVSPIALLAWLRPDPAHPAEFQSVDGNRAVRTPNSAESGVRN
jgi:hypothetical protein